MKDNIIKFILSFFFIGKIKFAPGTITSLLIAILWFFIPINYSLQIFLILIVLFIGHYFCYLYLQKNKQDKDPSFIVIDEVAGMMISLYMIPSELLYYLLAFILFRFFDIIKPSFIFRSQNLKFGIGIMLDDVLSGILTYFIIKALILAA